MVLRSDIDNRLGRIEKEFAASERLSRFGLRNKQKILLYGPPGCGKTLAAERLAFGVGLPLFKVRFDAVMSSLFGESASNLRQVFDAAEDTPCVLLLDECDFVARTRLQQNDVGEAPRIVNTFLQMLDDYNGRGLVVATTNLHTVLDSAVFRRFDESIEMPPPETGQVEELLRSTLSSIDASVDIRWQEIEEQLLGQSAATIVRVAQEAAKESILSGGRVVEQKHFARALSALARGP
nr:ATP-binding protein [Archangium primigenium]